MTNKTRLILSGIVGPLLTLAFGLSQNDFSFVIEPGITFASWLGITGLASSILFAASITAMVFSLLFWVLLTVAFRYRSQASVDDNAPTNSG